MSHEEARAIARTTVDAAIAVGADEAEALFVADTSALTRFAGNRIHQNVAEEDVFLNVRAVIGKKQGVASTNRLDEKSIEDCCARAYTAARQSPEDPKFPGLPAHRPEYPVKYPDRVAQATRDFDATARARAVEAIIGASAERGLTAAGKVQTSDQVTAVVNSKGIDEAMPHTSAAASVLSMGLESGSGWASFRDMDASLLDGAALGLEAAELAIRSANPQALDPGTYTVVLAPEAVGDIIDFLAYTGFSVRAYEEGRSFMSGKLEKMLMSEFVNIVDDALAPHGMGPTFDYEGCARIPTPLIEEGVNIRPVTDSYWAPQTGFPNTGHALPAPNSFGPLPLNLEMKAGDTPAEKLIASVKRGVYVTRFHYVNVEDPTKVLLTGMTRDGTFLIEDGELTTPLRNLRFTQSAVEALWECSAVSQERRRVGGEGNGVLAPYIRCDRFSFTGQTS